MTEDTEPAVEVVGDLLIGKCPTCGARLQQPNKGLGRASMATWKTRHQHKKA